MEKVTLKDLENVLIHTSKADGVVIYGNNRTSKETSEARRELAQTLLSRPRKSWEKAWDLFGKTFGPYDNPVDGVPYEEYPKKITLKKLLFEIFPFEPVWNQSSVRNLTPIIYDNENQQWEISLFGWVYLILGITRVEGGEKSKKKRIHLELRQALSEIFDVEPVRMVAYTAETVTKIVTDRVGPVIGGKNALLIVRSFQKNDGLKKREAEKLAEEILEIYKNSSLEKVIELFVDPAHLSEV